MSDLTKKEKRIARELISKGVEAEFEAGLKEAEAIIQEWKNKTLPGKEAFHKLRDHLNDSLKYLSRRYDNAKGSTYLLIVSAILNDGYIAEEDVKYFSDEAKAEMKRWIEFWKSEK